jgi:hypothetical protein
MGAPGLISECRERASVADQGGVFFGYFLLATQKKVFSRRSATGKCNSPVIVPISLFINLQFF